MTLVDDSIVTLGLQKDHNIPTNKTTITIITATSSKFYH